MSKKLVAPKAKSVKKAPATKKISRSTTPAKVVSEDLVEFLRRDIERCKEETEVLQHQMDYIQHSIKRLQDELGQQMMVDEMKDLRHKMTEDIRSLYQKIGNLEYMVLHKHHTKSDVPNYEKKYEYHADCGGSDKKCKGSKKKAS
jgi:peptidoglycan hydrolase CwlO-like protein